MKRVCFRSKRVCFSSANVGVVFSLFRNQKKVTVSALFCILMDNPWYTKGFSIRDIPHATLEEEEIFVSKKTWYRLLRKYCTAWEDRTYRPTGLRRAYRKTALTVDWLVGWLAAVLLLVEIMLWTLYCSLHYLGVVNANAFELATKCVRTRFILTLPLAGTVSACAFAQFPVTPCRRTPYKQIWLYYGWKTGRRSNTKSHTELVRRCFSVLRLVLILLRVFGILLFFILHTGCQWVADVA